MGKILVVLSLSTMLAVSVFAEDVLMKDGVRVWSDREQYLLSKLPTGLIFKKAVPRQRCSAREIVFPKGTKRAMIGLYDCASTKLIARKAGFKLYRGKFRVAGLIFNIYIIENPPQKIDCRGTNAGGILLALDDDVPGASVDPKEKK